MRRSRARNLSLVGSAASIAMAMAFLISLRWDFGYIGQHEIVFGWGGVNAEYVWTRTSPPPIGRLIWDGSGGFASVIFVRPSFSVFNAGVHVYLPFWIPLGAVAVPSLIVWWRNRPWPPGHCPDCGYNLAGDVSGICPECGKAVEST